MLYIFTAIFLAGSGVNSQTTYGLTSGSHGSMLFTLSLPVSRRRLLFVRAGLGAIQTSVLVAILAGFTLLQETGSHERSASPCVCYASNHLHHGCLCAFGPARLPARRNVAIFGWVPVLDRSSCTTAPIRCCRPDQPASRYESNFLSGRGTDPVAAYCGFPCTGWRSAAHLGAGPSAKRILISIARETASSKRRPPVFSWLALS